MLYLKIIKVFKHNTDIPPMKGKILVTGGAGYIGSHTVVHLLETGYSVVVLDNLSNAKAAVIDRMMALTGKTIDFVAADIRDKAVLDQLFSEHSISAVIHFAGLKAVSESLKKPLDYYDNNVRGTLSLLASMREAKVKTLVFSSSATVYGEPSINSVDESYPRAAVVPYGHSKLIIEDVLEDLHKAEPEWKIARLRYFNPIGAHQSGLIGEDPKGTPNNLIPYMAQVAVGRREILPVYGKDYPTTDGTGLRDYIHVMDLVEGHVAALNCLRDKGGMLTLNLGRGQGMTVLEMINAFERVSGKKVPYQLRDRRPGDVAGFCADPSRAKDLMGWSARRTLEDMFNDVWRWQSANPDGF